ncbi:MAG: type II toxin-antitoxin system HicA family toxin [Vicinamibacterales bacterium]|nr:type II toxin-antitoxin system HicA family toxin [Vicinamibacterales bacterium]
MAPRLRTLGGADVVAALRAVGFEVVAVRGSHAKLRRLLPDGHRQTMTVPLHKELARGTLLALYRQALRFIPDADLKPRFFVG